jgi:hypothetical protein
VHDQLVGVAGKRAIVAKLQSLLPPAGNLNSQKN